MLEIFICSTLEDRHTNTFLRLKCLHRPISEIEIMLSCISLGQDLCCDDLITSLVFSTDLQRVITFQHCLLKK